MGSPGWRLRSRLYARLPGETDVDVGLNQCGSLTLARTAGRYDELRYLAEFCRHHDIANDLIAPDGSPSCSRCAVPTGSSVPSTSRRTATSTRAMAALALAKGAHLPGAVFREGVSSHRPSRRGDGTVVGVETDGVSSSASTSCWRADCGRATSPRACGAPVPLCTPAAHVHVQTAPTRGRRHRLPVLRDLDAYFYARHRGRPPARRRVRAGRPAARPASDFAAGFAFGEFAPGLGPLRRRSARSPRSACPRCAASSATASSTRPESFTPDANFCLGETAEVARALRRGRVQQPGHHLRAGRRPALAEWIVDGARRSTLGASTCSASTRRQSHRAYLHERTREGARTALRDALAAPPAAHGTRRAAHAAARTARCGGCVLRRDDRLGASQLVRAARAVEPDYEYSYGRQNWFEPPAGRAPCRSRRRGAVRPLARSPRSRSPDRTRWTSCSASAPQISTWRRPRRATRCSSTRGAASSWTAPSRGSPSDRFLVVTPAVSQTQDAGDVAPSGAGRAAAVFDATSGLRDHRRHGATQSRADVPGLADGPVRRGAAVGRALAIEVAAGPRSCSGRASSASSVRDLPADGAGGGPLRRPGPAGDDFGLGHAGYHALDSLRCEKGYRHVGHDIGPGLTPAEAGLMFAVSRRKEAVLRGAGGPRGRPTTRGGARSSCASTNRACCFCTTSPSCWTAAASAG